MKTLYLDCGMGAAGDMLLAALLDLAPDAGKALETLNNLGLPGVRIDASRAVRAGVEGMHVEVTVHGVKESSVDAGPAPLGRVHHHHHTLADVLAVIDNLSGLSEWTRRQACAVYRLLAEAEGAVHGVPASEVHFHEVGSLDAIADIVGVCLLMEEVAPEQVLASPVNVGSGTVRCAHGVMPVPAPATVLLLRGVPIYSDLVDSELCTPTGAALLKHFVDGFRAMPVIQVEQVGLGMGDKEFEAPNCVRAFLGESGHGGSRVAELECNLDDMTPEGLGFVQELLLAEGALDVYTIPIGMKKSRPGVLLCCMCRWGDADRMTGLLLRHTSTLGVRITESRRVTLRRSIAVVETAYGPVRVKTSTGSGVVRQKVEYEDAARIAREHDLTLEEVIRETLSHSSISPDGA